MRRIEDRGRIDRSRLRWNHEDDLRAIRGTERGGAWSMAVSVRNLRLVAMYRWRLRSRWDLVLRCFTDLERNEFVVFAEAPVSRARRERALAIIGVGSERGKRLRVGRA